MTMGVALLCRLFRCMCSQKTAQEDLEFLRNQIITAEVNMARLYNYDVLKRRKAEETRKASEESKAPA